MSDFNFQIIHLSSVESTNIYALELLQKEFVQEGHVIRADVQTRGKGQSSNRWDSEVAKNLLFSLVLRPSLAISDRFKLSKMAALGIKKYLDTLAVGKVEIKWPNDILVDGEKVAGILIENTIQGNEISTSVIGVGLNVNQAKFAQYPRNATSLKLMKGVQFDLDEVLKNLLEELKLCYNLMKERVLNAEYLEGLYGYGIPKKFQDENETFIGVIVGVSPTGHLQLNKKGKLKTYSLKQIKLLN